jgi:hypothetical protein
MWGVEDFMASASQHQYELRSLNPLTFQSLVSDRVTAGVDIGLV